MELESWSPGDGLNIGTAPKQQEREGNSVCVEAGKSGHLNSESSNQTAQIRAL